MDTVEVLATRFRMSVLFRGKMAEQNPSGLVQPVLVIYDPAKQV